jgi:hypothetical protein
MIRTFKYRFAGVVDIDKAEEKIKRVVLHRSRIASNGLYGIATRIDGEDLEVSLRIGGHGLYGARIHAHREVDVLAKVLRMGPQTVTLIDDQSEPSLRNQTVAQGRAQSYENRTATRLRNRRQRLEEFRERNAEWLASPSR